MLLIVTTANLVPNYRSIRRINRHYFYIKERVSIYDEVNVYTNSTSTISILVVVTLPTGSVTPGLSSTKQYILFFL